MCFFIVNGQCKVIVSQERRGLYAVHTNQTPTGNKPPTHPVYTPVTGKYTVLFRCVHYNRSRRSTHVKYEVFL